MPLFTGLSGEDLFMVCEKVTMRWVKLHKGQILIQQDEPCTHLTFLLEGELYRSTMHGQNTWSVTDVVRSPLVIEPEQMYGLKCHFAHRYEAKTDCLILLIRKDEMRQTLLNLPLWRTNLLNLLASNTVKEREWNEPGFYDLGTRIQRFGLDHLSCMDRPHILHIRQVDLGMFLGESRRTISQVVHKLIDEGKAEIRPNVIILNEVKNEN